MYQFDDLEIIKTIKGAPSPDINIIKEITKKALDFKRLNLQEIDLLLKTYKEEELLNCVIESANVLKNKVFGNKVKIYVPVYITSKCVNNCVYCGFRKDNILLHRKRLSLDEFKKEIDFVLDIGHRTIELVLGSDPELKGKNLAPYIEITARRLKKKGGGSIILMSEPMSIEDYKILKEAGVNEVYCWQETFNQECYAKIHPKSTSKSNYKYRLTIFDRVLNAGIQRYGMGVLFGLYNWEYDMLSLLKHAQWLEAKYGIAPYAFGIPRFKTAEGALRQKVLYRVTNRMYRLAVAVYRLAFPTTHTYMNTRESLNLILDLLKGGGSEVNIEASTVPGGYTEQFKNGEQFFHYTYNSEKVFNLFRELEFEPAYR